MSKSNRPNKGVFIVWDEEEVDVARLDAGTMHDRTVVVGRKIVHKYALYTYVVSDSNKMAALRYAETIKDDYQNVRVEVFTGAPGSRRG